MMNSYGFVTLVAIVGAGAAIWFLYKIFSDPSFP
jgi:hypothetical protein